MPKKIDVVNYVFVGCTLIMTGIGEAQNSSPHKDVVTNLHMLTDPSVAHTAYVILVDEHGNWKMERKIKIKKKLTWGELEKNERKAGVIVKQYGLYIKSTQRYLKCIYDVTTPRGEINEEYQSYRMIGNMVVLPYGMKSLEELFPSQEIRTRTK